MNRIILAVSLASIMMGCSTAYRSGQTPDDVYFSPVRGESEYVITERNDEYRASAVPMEDRYLRMKSQGRSRWNAFDDDFAYWNNPYWNNRSYFDFYSSPRRIGSSQLYYGSHYLFGDSYYGNPFSPVYYGQPVIIINNIKPVAPRSNTPRIYSLSNYKPNTNNANVNPKFGSGTLRSNNQYYNNSGAPRGGYNSRSGSSSKGNPVRTFSNSSNESGSGSSGSSNSSSGSSSSGSKSSSAPVRSFPKGSN